MFTTTQRLKDELSKLKMEIAVFEKFTNYKWGDWCQDLGTIEHEWHKKMGKVEVQLVINNEKEKHLEYMEEELNKRIKNNPEIIAILTQELLLKDRIIDNLIEKIGQPCETTINTN